MAEHRNDEALRGVGVAPRSGAAIPIEAFVEAAKSLTPEEFEARHGNAFLLYTASQLSQPLSTHSTRMLLGGDDSHPNAHTANVSVGVFPLRPGSGVAGDIVTLGREERHDVVVPDSSVSRFHALGKPGSDGGFQVLDAGSTNGTTVNGSYVAGREVGPPTPLGPGDTLRLGQVQFTFTDARALREFALHTAG
jgi:hypothetical protein